MKVLLTLLLLSLAACNSRGPASEVLGPPISVTQAEKEMSLGAKYSFEKGRYDFGQEWEDFVAKIQPGDELRSYRHPAGGMGYAICRSGQVQELYVLVVF